MSMYSISLARGERIANRKQNRQDLTKLKLADSIALATYQFTDRWLDDYSLCEISFIAVQFKWLCR